MWLSALLEHVWHPQIPDAPLEANFPILGSDLVRKIIPQVTSVFSHNHKKCQFKTQSCVLGFKSTFARATCFRLDSCTVGHTKLRFKLHELRSAGSNGCLGDWFLDLNVRHGQVWKRWFASFSRKTFWAQKNMLWVWHRAITDTCNSLEKWRRLRGHLLSCFLCGWISKSSAFMCFLRLPVTAANLRFIYQTECLHSQVRRRQPNHLSKS